jgi:hypothetical protein
VYVSARQTETPAAAGRSKLRPEERLMPSPKLRADQQLLVIRAACAAVNPVGAPELAAATGISAKNCGLVPIFAMNTGLLIKGHRRAMYLPSEKGRYVARAFARGEAEGLEALRTKWKGQWFARTIKERCGYGPVSREGLVAKLMVAARSGEERIKQAQVLLDLMVAVGLVTVEESGELHWFEGGCYAGARSAADENSDSPPEEVPPADDRTESNHGDEPSEPVAGGQDGPGHPADSDQRQVQVPRARTEHPGPQAPGGTGPDRDLLSLLLPPVLLADLTRLTPEEILELHSHLTATTALIAKLRGQRVS